MTQFESSLELVDIARIFRRTLELEGRGVRFESIRDDDPFASLMRQPDFQCVASRVKSIGSWAVRLGISMRVISGFWNCLRSTTLHSPARRLEPDTRIQRQQVTGGCRRS